MGYEPCSTQSRVCGFSRTSRAIAGCTRPRVIQTRSVLTLPSQQGEWPSQNGCASGMVNVIIVKHSNL